MVPEGRKDVYKRQGIQMGYVAMVNLRLLHLLIPCLLYTSNPPLKQSERGFEGSSHDIHFENVHFSYKDTEVLHGIDLALKEGQMTALVGESGRDVYKRQQLPSVSIWK